MDNGQVVEVATPQALYHAPESEFATTFMGNGNVLAGRLERDHIRLGRINLPIPADRLGDYEDGAPVRILFRPEQVTLSTTPLPLSGNLHDLGAGCVVEQIFSGALQRLTLEMSELQGARPLIPRHVYGQKAVHIEAHLPNQTKGEQNYKPGTRLIVGLPIYHLLRPSGLKVMACIDGTTTSQVVAAMGLNLAVAASGPLTLLLVAEGSEDRPRLNAYIEDLRAKNVEKYEMSTRAFARGEVTRRYCRKLRRTTRKSWSRGVTAAMSRLRPI